ncbi:MAG: hypothetical protein WCE53_05670 [Candidatus Acidiferrum sp.]
MGDLIAIVRSGTIAVNAGYMNLYISGQYIISYFHAERRTGNVYGSEMCADAWLYGCLSRRRGLSWREYSKHGRRAEGKLSFLNTLLGTDFEEINFEAGVGGSVEVGLDFG